MSITIYHNPDCGTSRNVLALLREADENPLVIEYLQNPPDRATLERLIADSGMAVRDVLRVKGTPYKELRLGDPALSDARLIDAMLAHPILINRPFVVTPRGTRLCRPSDEVVGLLGITPEREILKEEGVPFVVGRPISGDDPGFVQALRDAELPSVDLKEPGRSFFAFSTLTGSHLGYGGFEQFGQDGLIRSLVIASEHRGKGIGRNVLAVLLRAAFDAGSRTAWLLTTNESAFFEKSGFKPVNRGAAPAAIVGSRQAADLCPSSAVLLSRAITL
ncbi:arsenate reductase (glutaredoxin) [Paraburkholderia sp. Tr-20389]|uniref:arsenate reductase (glutaredoxin) n=1 Tax=Paraburkholderia sp. Tr-20389 TaxID=2703903 RepID=UPI00197E8329|nr:arsenate reductase (glutaredoxin) [Paraburkholderia sp. Tr-20389]MBN3755558.1 arsenate reductase (glutaredoxin) [Paraburkholderia sp. Tr-20389]